MDDIEHCRLQSGRCDGVKGVRVAFRLLFGDISTDSEIFDAAGQVLRDIAALLSASTQ